LASQLCAWTLQWDAGLFREPGKLGRVSFIDLADVCDPRSQVQKVPSAVFKGNGTDPKTMDRRPNFRHLSMWSSHGKSPEPASGYHLLIMRPEYIAFFRRGLEPI
jgi:hypothetical protein